MIRLRRPHATAALLIVLAGALSACLLTPGRFTSALDLRRDGRFTFSYAGEIHMLALSRLAQMGSKAKVFEPETCYNDEAKERPCTAEELADQKKAFEDQRKERETKDQLEAEQMKGLLGGIDPSNPQAAEEMAARLRRQAGWKSVVYKGDGLFVVDFAITGRLDHDFVFPTIERVPLANAFVQLSRRADGTVRIDAPGYSAASGGGNPMTMALAGMASATAGKPGSKGDGKTDPINPFGPLEGTFVVTTDGAVLANNTDEGPQPDPAGQRLSWAVNARNGAPTALIRLAP
ncbi:MAG: hypothetical protein KGL54_13965 [Sphingomonadales bacterium]|nr:hypothetical protein [Sphingomonadales bacterium]